MAYVVKRKEPKTFDFKIEGSKKLYHVPVLSALPVNMLKKANAMRGLEGEELELALFEFFTDVLDKGDSEVLDVLHADDLAELFVAYAQASNTPAASAGE